MYIVKNKDKIIFSSPDKYQAFRFSIYQRKYDLQVTLVGPDGIINIENYLPNVVKSGDHVEAGFFNFEDAKSFADKIGKGARVVTQKVPQLNLII